MSKGIRRNSPLLKAIFENARNVQYYTLDNCFSGKPMRDRPCYYENGELKQTTQGGYLAAIYRMFSFARVSDDGGGRFNLHVTMREWYEFMSEARQQHALCYCASLPGTTCDFCAGLRHGTIDDYRSTIEWLEATPGGCVDFTARIARLKAGLQELGEA